MAINTRNICWRITVPRWCLRWHNKEACQIVSIVQIQSTNDKTEQETFSKCVLCIYLQSKLFIFVTRSHHFFQFGTHIYNMFCWVKVTLSICHASRSMSRNIPKGALKLDQVGIVNFFVGRCTRIPTFPKVNVYAIFMLHLMTMKEAFPFNILRLVVTYLANCIKNTL